MLQVKQPHLLQIALGKSPSKLFSEIVRKFFDDDIPILRPRLALLTNSTMRRPISQ